MSNNGLFLYYVNNDNRNFKSKVELKLQNLRVEPDGINQLEVLLKPG